MTMSESVDVEIPCGDAASIVAFLKWGLPLYKAFNEIGYNNLHLTPGRCEYLIDKLDRKLRDKQRELSKVFND
jgi:hypothetical protein